ncbi:MAG TPA: hypothetical protein VMH22_13805 [bacterium]|nr:hypothetical protein [bacterium]
MLRLRSPDVRDSTTVQGQMDNVGSGRRWWVFAGIFALAGAALVLISTARYGAGIAPDSVNYLDVARSLVAGKGFVFHDGRPMAIYPPLYSMLLALISSVTRLDPMLFAHVVNSVLFALVILMSAMLFRPGSRPTMAYGVLGMCAVLLSRALIPVYVMAIADGLFVTLVLVYLLAAHSYWQSRRRRVLFVMALAAAFACVDKYLGLALVLAGVLTMILAPGMKFGKRIVRACGFAAVALVPIALWMLHLQRLRHVGTAIDVNSTRTMAEISSAWVGGIAYCIRTALSWYLPGPAGLLLLLVLVVAATAIAFLPRSRGRIVGSLKTTFRIYLPSIILVMAYAVVLASALAARGGDGFVEERYVSYVYIPITLILLDLFARLLSPLQNARAGLVRSAPALLLAIWLFFPLRSVLADTATRFHEGAGEYNTTKWRQSETIAYARRTLSAADVHVYSDGPDALWELGRVNARSVPFRSDVRLDALRGSWPDRNGSVLVWFNMTWRKSIYSLDELERVAEFEEVAHLSDGWVYRVSPRPKTTADPSTPPGTVPGQPSAGNGRGSTHTVGTLGRRQ